MDKLKEAISRYGEVYKSEFRDGIVVWRPLLKSEHYDVKALAENMILDALGQEDYVWGRCVVYNTYTPDTLRAGIVSTVAMQIFYFTGFSTPDTRVISSSLNHFRDEIKTDPFEQATILICKAFPSYKPDDLARKTMREILKLVALAEEATGIVYIYGTPEEIEEQRKLVEGQSKQGPQQRSAEPRDPIRGPGGVDSSVYDRALNSMGQYGMNTSTIEQIPLIRKDDLYPEQRFVNTDVDNKRMEYDRMPFTEEYRREVLKQEW